MDAEQIRKQAQDENTAPEILAELANSEDKLTRQYIASNPNTSVETLEKLGEEFPDTIIENPIFNLLLLENPESYFVRLSLARSSSTDHKTLVQLSELEDTAILYALACNINMPFSVLEKLSDFFPLEVAANANTPLSVLEKLAADRDIAVKKAVARNKSTSAKILEKLACDRDSRVHRAIAQNVNTPTYILEILAAIEEDIVRDSILKHPNVTNSVLDIIEFLNNRANVNILILEKLAENPYLEVRRIVAEHIYTPTTILEKLAKEEDSKILEYVTIHPNVSINILQELAVRLIEYGKQDKKIVHKNRFAQSVLSKCYINLIENSHIQLGIKQQLADFIRSINYRGVLLKIAESNLVESEIILELINDKAMYSNVLKLWRNLAENLNTPVQAIVEIYNDLKQNEQSYADDNLTPKIYDLIYHHKNTSLNIKEEIVKNKKVSKLSIALNPCTSSNTLRELALDHPNPWSRTVINNKNTPVDVFEYFIENWKIGMTENVAMCKNTPVHILEMLAERKDIYTKMAIALNPSLPANILESLAKEVKYKIRINVAKNPSTPAYILDLLVSDPHPNVRFHAINNKNISNETLFRICESNKEKAEQIKLALLQRIITEENNLLNEKLINLIERDCSFPTIAKCVADNINSPVEVLEQLAENPDAEIREKAIKTLKSKFSVSSLRKINS